MFVNCASYSRLLIAHETSVNEEPLCPQTIVTFQWRALTWGLYDCTLDWTFN